MTGGGGCQCKVGRGIDEYDIDRIDEDLTRRWRGDGRDRQSVRELTDYFNRRLLRAAIERAGESPLDGEVENVYRLLTSDEVSSGVRTQTRRRLETAGVSLEAVEADFVSHQTLYGHLTECLGVSREDTEATPSSRRESDRERVRALQRRTEVVTSDALERLRDADALAIDDFDVLVDVTVLCADCGRQHDVGSLLDDGGCPCRL
jgi:hypothetical protein